MGLIKQSTAVNKAYFLGPALTTVTVNGLSKNCGAFAAPSDGTVTSLGNGWYAVSWNTTDTNTLGDFAVDFVAVVGTPVDPPADQVVAFDPFDAQRLGLTALPAADAAASGGLIINGSNTGAVTLAALSITTYFTVSGQVTFAGGANSVVISNGLSISGGAGNNPAITIVGAGTQAGITCTGGPTGPSIKLTGGGTSGECIIGTTTSGDCIKLTATGASKHGVLITGGNSGTCDGVNLVAGTGGVALRLGTLTVTGAVAFGSTFVVTTSTSFGALSCTTLTASGAVAFQSTFTVTTSTSLGALSCTTLTASGAVAFQSTLAVTGATTLTGAVSLSSTLGVTGTVTFNAFTVTNAFTVSGATTLTGAVAASNASNAIAGVTLGAGAIVAATFGANAITSSVLATDCLGSAQLASSAVSEIQSGLSTLSAADVWAAATRTLTAGTNIVLTKGTGVTGFNDILATAIVSAGAITTSGGAVSNVALVTTATNLANAPTAGDFTAAMKTSLNSATPSVTLADGSITDAKFTLPTEATGTPSTFMQLVMWLAGMLGWRKVVKDSGLGTIVQKMADGTTTKTSSAYTSAGGVDTINKAS